MQNQKRQQMSIAIPDSLFQDESTLREKTLKASFIARGAAIFGVERIYIYRDASRNYDRDYEIARRILQYAETPQYLRKILIPKNPDLEYVGIISPLRTPHHAKFQGLHEGDLREAALIFQNGKIVADVGAKELATYEGRGQPGDRVTVRIDSTKPLQVSASQRPEGFYWGYEVRRAPTLARFLRSANFELVILTTRKGDLITEKWPETLAKVKEVLRLCICFGSPEAGIDAMLAQDGAKFSDFSKALVLNMFPNQNVETIRLDEAILGTLSILNTLKTL